MVTETGGQGEHIVDVLLRAHQQAGSPSSGRFVAASDIYGRQQAHWFRYHWDVDRVFGLGITLDTALPSGTVRVDAAVLA